MIIHLLSSYKTVPAMLGVIWTTALIVIADTSPATPWILGALVPLSGAILLLLWKMQGRVSVLETQVTPLWSVLQKEVADALHRPHPEAAEMDKLLEKLENLTITAEERERLTNLLRQHSDDKSKSENERNQSNLLLYLMPLVVKQDKEQKDLNEHQL